MKVLEKVKCIKIRVGQETDYEELIQRLRSYQVQVGPFSFCPVICLHAAEALDTVVRDREELLLQDMKRYGRELRGEKTR